MEPLDDLDVRTSDDTNEAIRIVVCSNAPAAQGHTACPVGPVLGLHVARPAWVRHVRAGERTDTVFGPGDLTLIPGGCETTCTTRTSTSFVHVHLGRRLVARALERDEVELVNLVRFEDPLCRELVQSMAEEARAKGAAARLYLEHAGSVIAARLAARSGSSEVKGSGLGLGSRDLQRVLALLHARMAENPGLAELAAEIGMSPRHLARSFRRSTGQSVHHYYDRMRIDKAKELLLHTELGVLEIAARVGFANPSHFAAHFRRATGLSPVRYRAQSRS